MQWSLLKIFEKIATHTLSCEHTACHIKYNSLKITHDRKCLTLPIQSIFSTFSLFLSHKNTLFCSLSNCRYQLEGTINNMWKYLTTKKQTQGIRTSFCWSSAAKSSRTLNVRNPSPHSLTHIKSHCFLLSHFSFLWRLTFLSPIVAFAPISILTHSANPK